LGWRRKAALDELQASSSSFEGDADLLVDRDRHALLLHAVAQGRVETCTGRSVVFAAVAMLRLAPSLSSAPDVVEKCANVASATFDDVAVAPLDAPRHRSRLADRWSSTSRMGTISAAVPVKKSSSAITRSAARERALARLDALVRRRSA